MTICGNKRGNNNSKHPKFKYMNAQNEVDLQKMNIKMKCQNVTHKNILDAFDRRRNKMEQ